MPYGFNADKTTYDLTDIISDLSSGIYTKEEVDTKLAAKQKTITISDNAPTSSDGANGDIWIEY